MRASAATQRPRWAARGALLALAGVAYHGLALWDPRAHAHPGAVGWFFESSESSPQIIFAIVAALLFQRRKELFATPLGAPRPGLGALVLLLATALHLWAQWVGAPDLMVPSLALCALGVALGCGGFTLARRLAPPLALLVFAMPIPGALHNLVVFPAQHASARLADFGLRSLGYDVVIQSDILSIRGEKFEVIETCSGLRSLQTLALLAAAWAVYFRCPPRHAFWLLLSAPVIAFLTNGIRVMVLVVDTRPEVRESHVTQGVLMFLVGTVALSLVDRALLRLLRKPAGEPAPAPSPPPGPAAAPSRGAVFLLALPLAAMAGGTLLLPGLRPAASALPAPPQLPRELPGWRVRELEVPGHFLGNVYFLHRASLAYQRESGGEPITAFLGFEDRQLRVRSLLSEKNATPGSGWTIEERGPVEVAPGVVFERVVAHRFAERSMSLHAYTGVASPLVETFREAFGLELPGSPFARTGWAGLLRLSVLIEPGPTGEESAERALREFYALLAPTLGR